MLSVEPRELFEAVLLMLLPMEATPFGRSPRFRDCYPRKFLLTPSGDVHVGTPHRTWCCEKDPPVFIREQRRVEEVGPFLWKKLVDLNR